MGVSQQIETGVDRLIKLVQKKKRISVPDAAKELALPQEVIDEWATFLDEEGVLSIEYKFTTPYLVEHQLSDEEISKKTKDLAVRKQFVVRKAEAILEGIEKQHESIEQLKKDFIELRKDLGTEAASLESEFSKLATYDKQKKELDTKIKEEQRKFHAQLAAQSSIIAAEQAKYQRLLDQLKSEQKSIVHEQESAAALRQQESVVMRQLDQMNNAIQTLRQKIIDQDSYILSSEKNLRRILTLAGQVTASMELRKAQIHTAISEWKSKEQTLIEKQEQTIQQILAKTKSLNIDRTEKRMATIRVQKFFKSKQLLDGMVNGIAKEHEALRTELLSLVKAAKMVEALRGTSQLKTYADVQKHFENVDKKKKWIDQKMQSLANTLAKIAHA